MTIHTQISSPETKMGSATNVAEAFDDFMQAFEAFKDTNDERLSQIESRVSVDAVTEEKMNRITRQSMNKNVISTTCC